MLTWRWSFAAVAAACLAFAGCGDAGGSEGRSAAGSVAGPERLAAQTANVLATATDERDCKPLEAIGGRSALSFQCPLPRAGRRSMAAFEIQGSAVFGTGALVDFATGGQAGGANHLLYLTPDRKWAFSHFGLLYDPSVGSADDESRGAYRKAVASYLRAVTERDCDLYKKYAATSSPDRRTVCRQEFPTTRELASTLKANPDARPRYLGGTERFGFFALRLSSPKPSYFTISTLRTPDGSLRPALVVAVSPGPADAGGR